MTPNPLFFHRQKVYSLMQADSQLTMHNNHPVIRA
jgi:hypothetical protein